MAGAFWLWFALIAEWTLLSPTDTLRLIDLNITASEIVSGSPVILTAVYERSQNDRIVTDWAKYVDVYRKSATTISATAKWSLLRNAALLASNVNCTSLEARREDQLITELQTIEFAALAVDAGYYAFHVWMDQSVDDRNVSEPVSSKQVISSRCNAFFRAPEDDYGPYIAELWQPVDELRGVAPDKYGEIKRVVRLRVRDAQMPEPVLYGTFKNHRETLELSSSVSAFPVADTACQFKLLSECRAMRMCPWIPVRERLEVISSGDPFIAVSQITTFQNMTGAYRCCAAAAAETTCAFGLLVLADTPNERSLSGFYSPLLMPTLLSKTNVLLTVTPPTSKSVFEGENITISCYALRDLYQNLLISKDGVAVIDTNLNDADGVQLSAPAEELAEGAFFTITSLAYGERLEITIPNVNVSHNGTYRCVGTTRDYVRNQEPMVLSKSDQVQLSVLDAIPPTFVMTPTAASMVTPVALSAASRYEAVLACPADGRPPPRITWLFNGSPDFMANSSVAVYAAELDGKILKISNATADSAGNYACLARNVKGAAKLNFSVSYVPPVERRDSVEELLKAVFSVLTLVTLICMLLAVMYIRANKSEMQRFQEIVADFERCKVSSDDSVAGCFGNDSTTLIYQTDHEILESDLRELNEAVLGTDAIHSDVRLFELSQRQLVSERQSNASEADCIELLEQGQEARAALVRRVAVKSLQSRDANRLFSQLLGELKLWSTFELRHENVVEFVGAVTTCLSQRRLLVVFEFCAKGSLHSYLRRRSREFYDSVGEVIALDVDKFRCSQGITENGFMQNRNFTLYSRLAVAAAAAAAGSRRSLRNDKLASLIVLLFGFCKDAAAGLCYLHHHQIIHRDVATRNVLIDAAGTGKICDLGLAKHAAEGIYFATDAGKQLPFPWMAPESLKRFVFSNKSDVWSFGVLVWEVLTLASETPYSCVSKTNPRHLFAHICQGNFLNVEPCDMFGPPDLVSLMTDCFSIDDEKRPSASECVTKLDDIVVLVTMALFGSTGYGVQNGAETVL